MGAGRAAALGIAALGLVWTAWILAAGGIEAELLGVAFTSHEPLRPLAVIAIALALFVYLDGADVWHRRISAAATRVDERLVTLLLAAGTVVLGLSYATAVATGSDPYGYVSQADLWRAGDLRIEQPWVADAPWPDADWTFTPLGYRPEPGGETGTLVPTYSIGLPLLMAGTTLVAGPGAVYWIGPLAGGVLVLATWGIGRRMGSSRAGLVGAWLVATSPAFLFALMFPMSDVPAAAAWAVAFWLLFGPGRGRALAAGLAASVAILIRPNLAPAALALVAWSLTQAARARARRRAYLMEALCLVAGLVPGCLIVAAVNDALYGSPFVSGYGSLAMQFDLGRVLPNARRYLGWLVDTHTPLVLAGVAAVLVPARRLWPFVGDRVVFVSILLFTAVVVGEYLAYLSFDTWWFLRFLLPLWPFLMIAVGATAFAAARVGRPGIVLAAAGLVVGLGIVQYRIGVNGQALDVWRGERRYVAAAIETARVTPERSVVFTLQHSGSLRYYGGRLTMRYDLLDPAWLDRAIAWCVARDVDVYMLLETAEVEAVRTRFAGQRAVARLFAPPEFESVGPLTTVLFRLSGGGDVPSPGRRIELDVGGLRAPPPAADPTPGLR